MLNVHFERNHRARNYNEYWLVYDHFFKQELLYSSELMRVYEVEKDLSAGRFTKYNAQVNQHHVVSRFASTTAVTVQRVEWLAENVVGQWNVNVSRDTGEPLLFWSFDTLRDAALFKMVFADLGQRGLSD